MMVGCCSAILRTVFDHSFKEKPRPDLEWVRDHSLNMFELLMMSTGTSFWGIAMGSSGDSRPKSSCCHHTTPSKTCRKIILQGSTFHVGAKGFGPRISNGMAWVFCTWETTGFGGFHTWGIPKMHKPETMDDLGYPHFRKLPFQNAPSSSKVTTGRLTRENPP